MRGSGRQGSVTGGWGAGGGDAVRHRVQGARSRSRNGPKEEAVTFLRDVLAEWPMSANWIKEQAEKRGISSATLGRAKSSLKVQSKRREWLESKEIELGEPNSTEDLWFWWIAPCDRHE